MAVTVYKRTALIGGAAGALDNIDGADLLDGDIAFVMTSSGLTVHEVDDDSGATESSPGVISPDSNPGDIRWIQRKLATDGAPPIGSIISWGGGYFSDGSNGTFINVLGNTVASANTYLNPDGWYVCDGAALNDATSPIYNGTNRYLPDLTDSRFVAGYTAAGIPGGANTSTHEHTTDDHTLQKEEIPPHDHDFIGYTTGTGNTTAPSMLRDTTPVTGTTELTGGGQPHDHGNTGSAIVSTIPKFLTLFYIQRVN